MRHSFNAAKSALAWSMLCAVLLICAPGRAMAQADPGPIRPSAGQPDTGEVPQQTPPRSLRPSGLNAAPSNPEELSAAMREFNAKLTVAVAGWQDSSGAARKPKIIVLDFRTWDDQWLPFGAWLADKFSAAFSSNGGTFEAIDRAQLAALLQTRHLAPKDEFDSKKAVELAQSLGADILVDGRFSALDKDLGLTINARRALAIERQRPLVFVKSRITMSDDLAGHLGQPLDSLGPKRDAYSPGRDGVSYARCSYCPPPIYSETGRKKKIEGSVTLSVLITPEGRASEIQVTKSLEPSLDQEAVKAVRAWKFEPAKDSSGVPLAVHQAIQVSFHLY